MNYKLIGISGKIGSGKSSFAKYLQSANSELKLHSFAENVRKVVSIATGIDIENMRSFDDKNVYLDEWDKSVGELLQAWGTKGRDIHPDAWVNSLFATFNENSCWIIDDVRYPNEADKIKACGGLLIRLEGDPVCIRRSSTRNLMHESEMALDDYMGFNVIINTENFMGNYTGMVDEIKRMLCEMRM